MEPEVNKQMSDEQLADLKKLALHPGWWVDSRLPGWIRERPSLLLASYNEIIRLRAENERLTAWLTHIKNTGDEFGFIAEEALDGTPFEHESTS